jgi:hypothetical protein
MSVLSIVPLNSSFELQPKALVMVPPPISGAPNILNYFKK